MSWLYKNKISFIVYLIILALSVSFCHSLGYDRGYADGEKSNPNLFEFEGNIFKKIRKSRKNLSCINICCNYEYVFYKEY